MMNTIERCKCGSELPFENCCLPLITGAVEASDAESLMRSRFSAYVVQDYHYILNTYALEQRAKLTVDTLAESASGTRWLSLQVLKHDTKSSVAQVEFKAFYQLEKTFYVMHEISDFQLEQGAWRYTSGVIQASSGELKVERNTPCLCNSGKKFKKCCGA